MELESHYLMDNKNEYNEIINIFDLMINENY